MSDQQASNPIISETKFEKLIDTLVAVFSRVGVWGLLFFVLYTLRAFSLLIFLTFVFSYIQATGVVKLQPYLPTRGWRVVIVALMLLTVLIGIGAFVVPQISLQARTFADRYPTYLATLDQGLRDVGSRYPLVADMLHLDQHLSSEASSEAANGKSSNGKPAITDSVSIKLLQAFLGEKSGSGDLEGLFIFLKNASSSLLGAGSSFLLSLLFSFLIVLDLPALTKGVQSLQNTRINFIYEEVADSIRDFGLVVGRALEAQLGIAVLNTLLTALGLVGLGLGQHVAFLSTIVFVCSFIPVAGVFISSVPICLVALQESGFGLVIAGVVMITAVHMFEAYVLNPKIYGHHMRMNPVVVLIILTIAGKMFHVWGLVLGVPVCNYIFGHAIKRRA